MQIYSNIWYNKDMKKYIRWYDKDKYLSAFMQLLEDLDPEVQCEVAVDIILKVPKIIEKDYEKFVKIIADYNPREYKRWYDKNPNLHAAVEALRDLTDQQREDLINQISDIVLRHTKEQIWAAKTSF